VAVAAIVEAGNATAAAASAAVAGRLSASAADRSSARAAGVVTTSVLMCVTSRKSCKGEGSIEKREKAKDVEDLTVAEAARSRS